MKRMWKYVKREAQKKIGYEAKSVRSKLLALPELELTRHGCPTFRNDGCGKRIPLKPCLNLWH